MTNQTPQSRTPNGPGRYQRQVRPAVGDSLKPVFISPVEDAPVLTPPKNPGPAPRAVFLPPAFAHDTPLPSDEHDEQEDNRHQNGQHQNGKRNGRNRRRHRRR